MQEENAKLREENTKLRQIAANLHWQARRYADGRSSYAVSLHNDSTRELLSLGVPLNPTGDGTLWAKDGMRSDMAFNDPPDAFFEPGHPLATGAVLGLLPHRHLSRDLEAVLGTDPLRAIVRYAAAMKVVGFVRDCGPGLGVALPSLGELLREPLAALAAADSPPNSGNSTID